MARRCWLSDGVRTWLAIASAVAAGGLLERLAYYFVVLDRVIP